MSRSRLGMLTATAVALGLAWGWASTPAADPPARPEKLTIPDLSLEVAALLSIQQFQLTTEQMKALGKLAPSTRQEAEARPRVQASADYRKTLVALRGALVSGKEAEEIVSLQERLDKLRDAEELDIDDSVELTDAAREKAPAFLKRLSARQLAAFIGAYGDEFPDPREILLAAVGEARDLGEKDWKAFRDNVSAEVGRLVGGLDVDKMSDTSDKVVQFLIRIRAMSEERFEAEKGKLEDEARELTRDVEAMDVLRNVALQGLAELMSNPRLEAAVDALLAKAK